MSHETREKWCYLIEESESFLSLKSLHKRPVWFRENTKHLKNFHNYVATKNSQDWLDYKLSRSTYKLCYQGKMCHLIFTRRLLLFILFRLWLRNRCQKRARWSGVFVISLSNEGRWLYISELTWFELWVSRLEQKLRRETIPVYFSSLS